MATKCNRWLVKATFIQKYNISRFYQKQIPRSVDQLFIQGLFTQKNPRTPPQKKSEKNSKIRKNLKHPKNPNKIRTLHLGVNKPSLFKFNRREI